MNFFYEVDEVGGRILLGFKDEDVEREGEQWVVNFSNRKFSYANSPFCENEIFVNNEGQWQDKDGNRYKNIATSLSLPEVVLIKQF